MVFGLSPWQKIRKSFSRWSMTSSGIHFPASIEPGPTVPRDFRIIAMGSLWRCLGSLCEEEKTPTDFVSPGGGPVSQRILAGGQIHQGHNRSDIGTIRSKVSQFSLGVSAGQKKIAARSSGCAAILSYRLAAVVLYLEAKTRVLKVTSAAC